VAGLTCLPAAPPTGPKKGRRYLSDLSEVFTIPSFSDEELFLLDQIIKEVVDHPDDYREIGRWLDEHYSATAIRKRKADEPDRPYLKTHELETYVRFRMVIEDIKCDRINFQRMESQERLFQARKLLLILWLLIDPDAHTRKLGISRFEDWAWNRPIDGMPDGVPGRWYEQVFEFDKNTDYWLPLAKEALSVVTNARSHVNDNHKHPFPSNGSSELQQQASMPRPRPDAKTTVGVESDEPEQPPALTEPQRITLVALNGIDASKLASVARISDAIDQAQLLSEETTAGRQPIDCPRPSGAPGGRP